MNEDQRQLIAQITEQVLAVLRNRQTAQTPLRDAPTPVNPPLGTCTGGRDQPSVSSTQKVLGTNTEAPTETASLALVGIVTANRLQAAIHASPQGVALLSEKARLTPLAHDYARHHPEKIRRVSTTRSTQAADTAMSASADTGPWLWWIDGTCPVVDQETRKRQAMLRGLALSHRKASLGQVARQVAAAVATKQAPGAVLFVDNAALAMCYLNRCVSLRAVVGTCGEAVEQGIVELGANVLVIEYPHHGPRAVSAMLDRFLAQPPKSPPAVERDLAQLHRCL